MRYQCNLKDELEFWERSDVGSRDSIGTEAEEIKKVLRDMDSKRRYFFLKERIREIERKRREQ